MSAHLVRTREGRYHTDTVHVAGCAHTSRAEVVIPLAATTADDAQREIASSMGWDDYPADNGGTAFDIRVAPCVAKSAHS